MLKNEICLADISGAKQQVLFLPPAQNNYYICNIRINSAVVMTKHTVNAVLVIIHKFTRVSLYIKLLVSAR